MGNNVTFSQAHFDYTADLRQYVCEGYIQDEWRFRSNITLYYGVRYSFFSSPWDMNGRLSNFVPRFYNRANAPLVTGAGNRVRGHRKFLQWHDCEFSELPDSCQQLRTRRFALW